MKTSSWRFFSFVQLVAVLLAFSWPQAGGQTDLTAKRELVWPQAGREIRTPAFSPDGKFVVLVTKNYWPDGEDAEGLPDSFFRALEARAKSDPRFADPEIKVLDLTGKEVCETRYGWSPQLSPDDRYVLFSEQVKPITGLRELAETMAGNGIRLFDCESKQLTRIADPEHGYLDAPFFAPDGSSIYYTENEAVNGAFGGVVGLARFDPQQNRSVAALNRRINVPAAPCPPPGSGQPEREAFLCSQIPNLTSSFPQIVFQAGLAGKAAIALVGLPVPAVGDMYLAKNYDMRLVSLEPEEKTILNPGLRSFESEDGTRFQSVGGARALLFFGQWKLYSLETGNQLPDPGPKNANRESLYSPDLRYYLVAETSKPGQDPDHFVLYRTADGKRVESLRRMARVFEAVWSPEASRFAFVGVPLDGASARHHAEELTVYSVR